MAKLMSNETVQGTEKIAKLSHLGVRASWTAFVNGVGAGAKGTVSVGPTAQGPWFEILAVDGTDEGAQSSDVSSSAYVRVLIETGPAAGMNAWIV